MAPEVTTSYTTKIRVRALPTTLVVVGFALAVAGALVFIQKQRLNSRVTCATVDYSKLGLREITTKSSVTSHLDTVDRQLVSTDINILRQTRSISNASEKKKLQQLLANRKEVLVKAIRENPEIAAQYILPSVGRENLERVSMNCVERLVDLKGKVEVFHIDDTDQKASANIYSLETPDHKRYTLRATSDNFDVSSGTIVTIKGLLLDQEVLFAPATELLPSGDSIGAEIIPESTQPTTTLAMPDQTLILLSYFNDTPAPTLAVDTVRSVMNNVSSFFMENSYGQEAFSGALDPTSKADIVGWFQINDLSSGYGCGFYTPPVDMNSVLSQAKIANPELVFSQYSRFIWVAPFGASGSSCGTVGKTSLSTPDGIVQASATWMNASNSLSFQALSHELGHNMGNYHANYWSCGSQPINSSQCTSVEYGDAYDVMGTGSRISGQPSHFNAVHKENSGWLAPSQMQTVTASGQYTVEPIETATSGTKVLKIRRSTLDYMYIEYRQPIGYDFNISQPGDNIYSGALLHIHPRSPSLLIHPFATGVALLVGQIYTDPITGTTVRVVSATSSLLTVDIGVGNITFPPAPPSASIIAPSPYSNIAGTIDVLSAAVAEAGIQSVEYFFSPYNPLPTYFPATPAGGIYQASIDTTHIPNGLTYFRARVYDQTGQVGGETQALPVLIDNQDSNPPVVAIMAPANNSVVVGSASLEVQASDDIGVWKIEYYKDSENYPFDVSYQAPYTSTAILPEGAHSFTAKAYDFAGNVTVSMPVSLTIDNTPPSVSLISPINGDTLSGTSVNFSAGATDTYGIQRVKFYLISAAGPILLGTDISSSYGFIWNSKSVSNGNYQVLARAFDQAGNAADSSTIAVGVSNSGGGAKKIPLKVE